MPLDRADGESQAVGDAYYAGGEHRVISMEMMGKIRRMYFRDKLSLHEITKRTGLARNTIRKWVRAPRLSSRCTSAARFSTS